MLTHGIGGFFSSTLGFFLLTFYNILFLLKGFLLDAAFQVFLCRRPSRLVLLCYAFSRFLPPSPPPSQSTSWTQFPLSPHLSECLVTQHLESLSSRTQCWVMVKYKLSHHSNSKIWALLEMLLKLYTFKGGAENKVLKPKHNILTKATSSWSGLWETECSPTALLPWSDIINLLQSPGSKDWDSWLKQ